MTQLYVITNEYRAAAAQLADLDLPPEVVEDTLESLAGDIEAKAQNVAFVARNCEALAAQIKDAEKQMADRRKALEARVSRLRDYMLACLLVAGIKKIEDMKDKVLVAVLGTTNEKAAQVEIDSKKIAIKGEIIKVKDHSQAMLNLDQGRADAYVSDDVVLYGLKSASKNPDEWEIVGPYFSYDPYGMMIPRNNDDWRLIGNKTIAKLIQTGEMVTIYKKWFEPGPTKINYPLSDRLKENFELIALPD